MKMKGKSILVLLWSFMALGVSAVEKQGTHGVIYGEDNRWDIYNVSSPLYLTLARSTAAMINRGRLVNEGEFTRIKARTLGEERPNLCWDEPFREQAAAAECTGFLVGEDVIMTAGHCAISSRYNRQRCSSHAWVFDFVQSDERQRDHLLKTENSVYHCKKILVHKFDSKTKNDFALIRLDRKVRHRRPLKVRESGKVESYTPLVVIGHPVGLPMKVADGAWVRNNRDNFVFIANLDTYQGNSGSPVFNSETGLLEGVLTRGEMDFAQTSQGCMASKRCQDDSCRGETVVRVTNAQKFIQQFVHSRRSTSSTTSSTTFFTVKDNWP